MLFAITLQYIHLGLHRCYCIIVDISGRSNEIELQNTDIYNKCLFISHKKYISAFYFNNTNLAPVIL